MEFKKGDKVIVSRFHPWVGKIGTIEWIHTYTPNIVYITLDNNRKLGGYMDIAMLDILYSYMGFSSGI